MTMATESNSQARLERMLAEGKITREQFVELKAALSPVEAGTGQEEPPRDVPGPAAEGEPPPSPVPGSEGSRLDSSGRAAPPPPVFETLPKERRFQPGDRVPLSVWICIGVLVVAGLASLVQVIHGHPRRAVPAQFVATVLDFTLAWFLYLRWKWAFYAAMSIGVLVVVVSLVRLNIPGAILNGVFLVFLWQSRDWFLKTNTGNR